MKFDVNNYLQFDRNQYGDDVVIWFYQKINERQSMLIGSCLVKDLYQIQLIGDENTKVYSLMFQFKLTNVIIHCDYFEAKL